MTDLFQRMVTSPAPRDIWRALLAQDEEALLFQTPEWMDCLCAAGGYEDASRLYQLPDGQLAVLPLARWKGLPSRWSEEASLPHGWGMGGPVTAGRVGLELARLIFSQLARQPALRVTLRPNPLQAALWAAAAPSSGFFRQQHSTHILDISRGFGDFWSQTLSSSARTKIRKAEKSGLEITCGRGDKLIPVFYDLYMEWIDRRATERGIPLSLARLLGRWREPRRKFETVARALGDACHTWVAWKDGQAAAASILLLYRGQAIYWRNASSKSLAGPSRANDLVQRYMIEDACQAGCRYYHMGESGGVPSLIHFKERFGAQEYPYTEYSIEKLPITALQDRAGTLLRRLEKKPVAQEGEFS